MCDLEYMPINCKSILALRAIALMLSGENFLSGRVRCEKTVFIFVGV